MCANLYRRLSKKSKIVSWVVLIQCGDSGCVGGSGDESDSGWQVTGVDSSHVTFRRVD